MSDKRIVQYYLLCTTSIGMKKHMVNEIPRDKLNAVLTKKEVNLFLREREGYYIAREIVVGGAGHGSPGPIIIIGAGLA